MLRVESVQLVENQWTNFKSAICVSISDSVRSCLPWTYENTMVRSAAPAPQSNNKNYSMLVVVIWNSIGRTGIAAMLIGSGGKLLSWRAERIICLRFSTTGKLISSPSNVLASCSAKICWFVNTVSVVRRFFPGLTFATSQLVWLVGYECWFVFGFAMLFSS